MKTPLVLSLLILAVGAAIGWSDHQRLLTVRAAHAQAVSEAAKRGISLDSSSEAVTVRITKRERENREAAAKLLAVEYIGFAKEKEALRNKREKPDEAFLKRELDFDDRMNSLDSAQWKIVIAEVCACKELKDGTRQAFLYNSITTFAEKHPQAALAFLAEVPDLFKGGGKAEHLVSTALRCWSQDNPMAAMEWILTNGGNQSPLISDDTKREMISAEARRDPALAFNLIGKMALTHEEAKNVAIGEIIGAATTPEKRMATLTALRGYLTTLKDEKSREEIATISIMMLSNRVCQEGFGAASRWVASADLTPKELASFAVGLNAVTELKQTGQWIEWIGRTLPAAQADQTIRNLVSQWTISDYQAAGKWLGTAPDGPAKISAVRAYAETVAKYEPTTAAQWAMILPPGKDRDQTLKTIYNNWPKDAPAAKEAFKKGHGIE